jgi:SAM-dependent methyltransferase
MMYGPALTLAHDLGFRFHGDRCAPGILELIEPVRGGLVLELGCGSGSLTRHLLAAGHRVLATDASPDMVERARAVLPGADVEQLVLPDDPLPAADAVVGVGNVLNYLDGPAAAEKALVAIAAALRPGGVLALDPVDVRWGREAGHLAPLARVRPQWALYSTSALPEPHRLIREMVTFVREDDGRWRREDERHEITLLDTERLASVLTGNGVEATVRPAFGAERMRPGMMALVGHR